MTSIASLSSSTSGSFRSGLELRRSSCFYHTPVSAVHCFHVEEVKHVAYSRTPLWSGPLDGDGDGDGEEDGDGHEGRPYY